MRPIKNRLKQMKIQSSRIKLDKIDRKILDILQSNAKITNAQLSKDIGLSPAPTLERVKKLETSGIIKSYHAKLDTDKIGLGVHTFVQVSLKGHNKKNIDAFINEINSISEVIECHHITGSGDFILKIIASDIQSYQKLMLEKVSEIDVVDGLQSMIILSTFKDSKVMPVPENE
ncbi:transcriptional regulator, AsnC family [Ekhidna lutea]|uniref:Transcriptional regulator, AsnC family n=2 Tax=Ekhidna lutea TaxID=447679 RepID=A0A239J9H9_EKHLU|nr:transcriptional regulator, AsnC family [Ekhidna lutea]